VPVIIAPALPLALRLAANELLGMIGSRLKDLLTIWTAAITHETAPGQNAMESFCSEPPLTDYVLSHMNSAINIKEVRKVYLVVYSDPPGVLEKLISKKTCLQVVDSPRGDLRPSGARLQLRMQKLKDMWYACPP